MGPIYAVVGICQRGDEIPLDLGLPAAIEEDAADSPKATI
jgi:hypothetical protein